MNIETSTITKQLTAALAKGKRYAVFSVIIAFLLLYSFLVYEINSLITAQPSDEALLEQMQTVQRPRVDQSALNAIQQLQDQNVQVQSIFDDARNNPFVE